MIPMLPMLITTFIDVCDLSISLNKCPSTFKLAKIKPNFKTGRKTNISNWRSIALLSLFLKAIEKVVHEQITKFFSGSNIFWKYKSCFRRNHSADLFLLFLKDKFLKHFDNDMYTATILVEIQKAFVVHSTKFCLINPFLQKLQIVFQNLQIFHVVFCKLQF